MYSLVQPGLSPLDFGAGTSALGTFASNFANSTTNALRGGMRLGTELTQYGAFQRLSPFMERNALQGLNTGLTQQQNAQLRGLSAQQIEACTLDGWRSPQCQYLRQQALSLGGVDPATGRQPAEAALGLPTPQQSPAPWAQPLDLGGFSQPPMESFTYGNPFGAY